ncbi:hypothetical protein SK128_015796 [Halocaridina rubra]|uniref:Uncharacterized protein n=1 Tax=Halocaridina rubra TaxID=373956 RepID=A0AAN8ZYD5_HALRR
MASMMTRALTCLLVLLFYATLSLCDARICYKCVGDCVTDSECKGSCLTKTHELGDEPEVRSCIDDIKEAGCHSHLINGSRYKVCYCNTERCNGSSYLSATMIVLLTALLLCYSN